MKKASEILTGLLWTVFILCLSVTITLNVSFVYKSTIKKENLEAVSGLSNTQILENYYTLINYNNLGGPDTLEFPDFPMSEGGRIHFEEVRVIFQGIEKAAIITGVLVLVLTLLMNKLEWYRYRLWGSMITLILPIIIGALALLFWDTFFVKFHEIVFNNDYWLFDYTTDPVILILPERFFRNSAFLIVEFMILGAVLLASAYRRTRPLSPEEQAYLDEKTAILEKRQKEYEKQQAAKKEQKKGKRLGKHDFNLTEKANKKLKDL